MLRILRKFYGPSRLEEARSVLPDPVDVDRDRNLLARFGLTLDDLYDAGGLSP